MKILTVGNLYPPNHLGGYELMWEAAVEELRRRGHDVRVLCNPELTSYWKGHKWPLHRKLRGPLIEAKNRRVFDQAAADADIVSFWSMGGMSMSLVEHRPSLAVVMDDWLLYGPLTDPMWVRKRPPKLDRPLYISAFTAERAGQPGEVLHAGYDERVFTPVPAGEWRGQLYLPGRLDPRKGQRTAIAALPDDMTLLISGVGDAKYGKELQRLARGRRGVLFSETRDRAQIAREYAAADAVLFPAEWSEPFGLVPLEAMGVGRPVIATGVGGSAEYLRDGENCLLAERGNADALREAIVRLSRDPELRDHLVANGFATAAELTLSRFLERVADAHEAYGSPS